VLIEFHLIRHISIHMKDKMNIIAVIPVLQKMIN